MFEFSAGSLSLCLVDTVGDRGGVCVERLGSPADLTRWLREASLIGDDDREAGEPDLADMRALRDAVYRSACAIMDGTKPKSCDIDCINALARLTPPRPQWWDGRVEQVAGDGVRAALPVLAADAVGVLASPLAARVRLCPACKMMFLDRSPAGRRRWCSSASGCGNRAKVRQHRARRAAEREIAG